MYVHATQCLTGLRHLVKRTFVISLSFRLLVCQVIVLPPWSLDLDLAIARLDQQDPWTLDGCLLPVFEAVACFAFTSESRL